MKLNIDANVIKSPLQEEFVIADRIQLETDNLSIMLNAVDINVPINNINTGGFAKFSYEGRQKEGNWMSYWVNVKAKDLIELYPHVHAHKPGAVSQQTPYDFQLTIGHGIEARNQFGRDPNQPEDRYVEVYAMEAGSEELAVRQVLSVLAGQLLTTHRANAHIVNMVGVHIAEQLIQLGMTHFKQGDIKFNGHLHTHSGLVQTERLWRLGNPGTGKLSLRQTLLTEQVGPNTRTTHLIGLDEHQIFGVDGKYQHSLNGNNGMGMMYSNPWVPGMPQPHQQMMQPQMYPPQQHMMPQSGGMPDFQQMQMMQQSRPAPISLQQANLIVLGKRGGLGQAEAEAFAAWGIEQVKAGNEPFWGTAVEKWKSSLDTKESNEVPASNNRSLSESDIGPRNEDTPIHGEVMYIEVVPVRLTEDEASIVTDGSQNAYGVYRRESQGGITPAVHVGDFLTPSEAVEYGSKLGRLFGVPTEDYVSPAPADNAE